MKNLLYPLLICSLLTFSGCTFDHRYEAEKAYWEARELSRMLQKENPDGLEEEHYEQVITALNKVSNAAPFEPVAARAKFQIAQIYLGLERKEQSHDVLREVFTRFTNGENRDGFISKNIAAQALFSDGRLYEADGEIEKAHERFALLMDKYPLTNLGLQVPLYIIQYYKSQEDLTGMKEASANAQAHYQKLMDQYAGTTTEEQVQRYSLQAYAQEEAWQDILEFWDSASKTKIERSEVLQARVAKANLLASKMGRVQEAEAIYKDIIENFPVEPITPFLRVQFGYLLTTVDKFEEARETFQKVVDEFSDNEELKLRSLLGLASVDAREGKYEEALQRNIDVFTEYPNNATTLKVPFMKYLYYKGAGKEENEVEQALEEAIAEYSSRWKRGQSGNVDKISGRLLFSSLIQKKDWDAAATHFDSFMERFPNDPSFIRLSKAISQKESDSTSKTLQIFFDPSSDSPLFQPEDTSLQDIGETIGDPLEQP